MTSENDLIRKTKRQRNILSFDSQYKFLPMDNDDREAQYKIHITGNEKPEAVLEYYKYDKKSLCCLY